MDLKKMIMDQIGGSMMGNISKSTGHSNSTIMSVAAAALPMLLGTLGKNASTPHGAAALNSALEKDHSGDTPTSAADGTKILAHVFGDNQDAVQQQVAAKAGVDPATAGSIMSHLAPAVMAQLGQQKKAGGLDASGLAGMLGGQTDHKGNSLMGLATSFLDKNHDGSVIDDLFGMFSKK